MPIVRVKQMISERRGQFITQKFIIIEDTIKNQYKQKCEIKHWQNKSDFVTKKKKQQQHQQQFVQFVRIYACIHTLNILSER